MRVLSRGVFCALVAAAIGVANGQKGGAPHDDPFPPLPDYLVRTYSPSDGLTALAVTTLAQTPDGFLFVGTGAGVFRFNSRAFESIPLAGFAATLIEELFVDTRGLLWVRSTAGDIAYLDNGTIHVLGRVGITVNGFTSTSDGAVWLSGKQGLVRVRAGAAKWFTIFTHADGLPSDTVAGVYEMQNGDEIVPSNGGLSRIVLDPQAKSGLRFEPVASFQQTANQGYVRNDANGLWMLDLFTRRMARYHNGIVTNIDPREFRLADLSWGPGDEVVLRPGITGALRDADDWARDSLIPPRRQLSRGLRARDGTRWIDLRNTTRHSSLVRLAPGSTKPDVIDLSGYPGASVITALREDHEGSIWIGTDRGLLQLVKRRVRAVAQHEGLPRELAQPVLQTHDGAVWVGTWGNGLFRFEHGALAEQMTVAQGLPDDRIRSLLETSDGSLWVGTRRGAARLVHRKVVDIVEQFADDNEIRAIAETRDHVVWMATGQEVAARGPDGRIHRILTEQSLGPSWAIFAEPTGSVLVGTQRGLFRISPELTATPIGRGQGLDDAFVTAISTDLDGTIWVGTFDRGLFRLRPTGIDHVDATTGIPSSCFFVLDDGHGGIWVSGNQGLWRVSKDSLRAVADDIARGRSPHLALRPVPFLESEGAPGREGLRASPGGWHLRDGRLVFNNSNGLTVVDLADMLVSRVSPRTIVLSVTGDGQRIAENDHRAVVPAQTRRVEIDFATLSFIAPRQHRFRYRLDGFDHDWTEVGFQARTSYTNLHPGRYTFRVQAVRPPGATWAESDATQVIDVEAAWWQTRLFQLAVLMVVCVIIYGLHRLRLHQAVAIYRVRETIASDLHDDLGSSINSIRLMTQLLERDAEHGSTTHHQLSRIQRAAEETAMSIRHLVWLVDPVHTNLDFLILRVRRVAGDLLPAKQIEFDVAESLHSRRVGMTAMRSLLLIFKEALNNVARHAEATRVVVRIAEQRGTLAITIRDDGSGFDATQVDHGNGLNNMRRRMQEIGGDLVVDTAPGRGTTILVTVRLS